MDMLINLWGECDGDHLIGAQFKGPKDWSCQKSAV